MLRLLAPLGIAVLASCALQSTDSLETSSTEQGAYMENTWWVNQNRLYVCFENPTTQTLPQQEVIKKAIDSTWDAATGRQFLGWDQSCATTPYPKNIRIRLWDHLDYTVGPGPQIYAHNPGCDIYGIACTKDTGTAIDGVADGMNLYTYETDPNASAYLAADAVHEFGHALGFEHEQNRDDTPSSCNARDDGGDGVTFGPWDPYSVMNYCGPNGRDLSGWDIAGADYYYGAERAFALTRNSEGFDVYERNQYFPNSVVARYWQNGAYVENGLLLGMENLGSIDGHRPTSAPAAASNSHWGAVAVRDYSGGLAVKMRSGCWDCTGGQIWGPWQDFGGQIVGDPTMVAGEQQCSNRVAIFAVNEQHQLTVYEWDAEHSTTGWQTIGGTAKVFGKITAMMDGNCVIQVYAAARNPGGATPGGGDDVVYTASGILHAWANVQVIGGNIQGSPTATVVTHANGDVRTYIFARSAIYGLSYWVRNGGLTETSGTMPVGPTALAGSPAAVTANTQEADVFVRDTSDRVWQIAGSSVGGWTATQLTGAGSSDAYPALASPQAITFGTPVNGGSNIAVLQKANAGDMEETLSRVWRLFCTPIRGGGSTCHWLGFWNFLDTNMHSIY